MPPVITILLLMHSSLASNVALMRGAAQPSTAFTRSGPYLGEWKLVSCFPLLGRGDACFMSVNGPHSSFLCHLEVLLPVIIVGS